MAYAGIGPTSLQIATPPSLGEKASAIYLIAVNLIGAIGGPLAVALLTDYALKDEAVLGVSMSLFAAGTSLCGA